MSTSGQVFDYTARINPQYLRAAGAAGVCRYLAPDTDLWKRITPSEYRELVGAGLAVFLNWEHSAHDWLTFGGSIQGSQAAGQAQALGYPRGSVIFGSCDFDITIREWQDHGRAYLVGFATALKQAGYRPGVYGPWDAIEWSQTVGVDAFWQAGMATAWSAGRNAKPHPRATLRQISQTNVGGQSVDANEVRQSLAALIGADMDATQNNRLANSEAMLGAFRDLAELVSLNPMDPAHPGFKLFNNVLATTLRRIDSNVLELVRVPPVAVDAVRLADSLSDSQLATIGRAMADRFFQRLAELPEPPAK